MTDRIRPSWPNVVGTASPESAESQSQAIPPAGPSEERLSLGASQLVSGATRSNASLVASLSVGSTELPAAEAPGGEAHRSAAWYADKAKAEAACLLLPCKQALELGKLEMQDGGLAERMLSHFTSGAGDQVVVDLNREFERNPQLREALSSRIEQLLATRAATGAPIEGASGSVWISQGDYGRSAAGIDQQRALGGTFFEFCVNGTATEGGLEVTINVADNYFWSPSDGDRATQCLHECGVAMVAEGRAVEFDQVGEGRLVVVDPRTAEPMALLSKRASSLEN